MKHHFFSQYIAVLAIFLAIDSLWLLVVAPGFYATHLGWLMSKSPNLLAALAFYLLYVVGIIMLPLARAVQEQSYASAIRFGGVFGLCAYATYDLTNMATIDNWPAIVTFVDLAWGTILTALTTVIAYHFVGRQAAVKSLAKRPKA